MKYFDRVLQKMRTNQVLRHIQQAVTVLDVGSSDGYLFKAMGSRLLKGYGIDPEIENSIREDKYDIIKGYFPADVPAGIKYDVITMVAVIEHLQPEQLEILGETCSHILREEGRVIITVPSPLVDKILEILLFFRIIDGMSLDEHHGFKPSQVPGFFRDHFTMEYHKRFQFGLNHIFVFRLRPKTQITSL